MVRALVIALLACSFVSCATQELALNAAPMVDPAPELKALERFVGDWSGTSQVVSGDPAAFGHGAMTQNGESDAPAIFQGGAKTRWVLGGMFVRTESWLDVGDRKVTYVDFKTWDATARKYRSWYFSDMGESGESWMTLDADGSTFHVTASGTAADGTVSTGSGSITFAGSGDAMDWTWSEDGAGGTLSLKGRNERR